MMELIQAAGACTLYLLIIVVGVRPYAKALKEDSHARRKED